MLKEFFEAESIIRVSKLHPLCMREIKITELFAQFRKNVGYKEPLVLHRHHLKRWQMETEELRSASIYWDYCEERKIFFYMEGKLGDALSQISTHQS